MEVYEVRDRLLLLNDLVDVWEDSVRATHHFLSYREIERIKEYVPQALNSVEHLVVVESDSGEAIAFMGSENNRLEMLFVSSAQMGKGIGKRLIQYAIRNYGVRELTVNEENPQAIDF